MAITEFVKNPYLGFEATENLVHYVTRKKITGEWVNYYGGVNVDVYQAAAQMEAVRRYFRKSPDCRQMRHVIVSFAANEQLLPCEAAFLAEIICQYYADRYQLVWGVHEDTNNLHIHISFNATSFVDGKLYSKGCEDYWSFRSYVDKTVDAYLRDGYIG